MGNPRPEDYPQLRKSFDGDDLSRRDMSTGGNDRSGHAARVANAHLNDPWAFDDEQVRLVLLRVFPNINTIRETRTQRERSWRWLFIIQHFFRLGERAGTVALKLFNERIRKKFE